MAGQEELIIKLIILTVVLVALGVGGYFGYKYYQKECPDGLFVCMGIDDADADADAGGAGPGGAGPGGAAAGAGAGAGAGNQSGDYTECTRHFSKEDRTKTCYDPGAGKGGIRWFWADTTGGKSCLEKTKFYKIEASTAANDHKLTYEYIQPGGLTNGFIFQNAGNITQKDGIDMNVRFNITPLDKDKKVLADPLMGKELNPGGGVKKDCTAIGVTPKDFNSVFNVEAPEDKAPPPPPPVDCTGSFDSNWGECTTDLSDAICGLTPGKQLKQYISTQQPAHGGKGCPGVEKKSCYMEKNCRKPTVDEVRNSQVCQFGPEVLANGTACETSCVDDENKRYKRNDGSTNEKTLTKSIQNVNFAFGKVDCQIKELTDRKVACPARPMCPVDCQGSFNASPDVLLSGACKRSDGKNEAWSTKKTYVVTTPRAHGGAACPYHNGQAILGTRYVSINGYCRNCDECPT